MRQEANEFQSKIEAEFDKHRSQFDEAFRSFNERFDSNREFSEAFSGAVAEHLKLARDEGARITANAIAEAEKMEQDAAPPAAPSYDRIRDAVNDISAKDSQSAILKSLVQNAGEFAARGAFFIIKNDHFVGWKVFGDDLETAESAIREIHFPTSSDSILGSAVRAASTVESSAGSHSDDDEFLTSIEFGSPEQMYAVPLMARGRAVAVLYADQGEGGGAVNREALETIVRVAGLTVELLAATQTAQTENRPSAPADLEDAQYDAVEETTEAPEHVYFDSYRQESPVDESVDEMEPEAPSAVEVDQGGFAFSENISFDGGYPQETPYTDSISTEAPSPFAMPEPAEEVVVDDAAFNQYETQPFESEVEGTVETQESSEAPFTYDSDEHIESGAPSPFDQAVESFEPAQVVTGGGYNQVAEQVVEAPPAASAPAASYARLSDRPVDLPIEVPEDERRIHNDARRFARLLVSEIKLYNEKKVVEGREAQDLYERLREAIDRSREMYDKRVQPPVAAKFDYFHYEIVNSLADGEAQRLGSGYPGSRV
jgi:hypothetical protein